MYFTIKDQTFRINMTSDSVKGKADKAHKRGRKKNEDLLVLNTEECYNTSKVQVLQINSKEIETSESSNISNSENLKSSDTSDTSDISDSSDSSSSDDNYNTYGKFCKETESGTLSVKGVLESSKAHELNIFRNVRTINSDQIILPNDSIIIVKSKISIKVLLPELPVVDDNNDNEPFPGRYLKIKNKNNNIDTYIIPAAGNTINDLTSYTLRGKKRIDLVYTGKTWTTL